MEAGKRDDVRSNSAGDGAGSGGSEMLLRMHRVKMVESSKQMTREAEIEGEEMTESWSR